MKILVTGASGFVGRAVIERLRQEKGPVRCAVRKLVPDCTAEGFEYVAVGQVDSETDWQGALEGIDTVIHLVARTHVTSESQADSLPLYRRVNVDGTLALAQQAVKANVRRIIFVSSIKVNGGRTYNKPFTETDVPAPEDAYGISKREAEDALVDALEGTGVGHTIVRPPLIYGPGVKANFLSMMRWLYKGIPLPLGAIHNKRSFVALENLVDLIVTCVDHPAAANQVFLASDGEDLSTTELLTRMGNALGRSARLLPVPAKVLELGATLLGKQAVSQRLCGSLQVDITRTRELLNWNPPVSVDVALRKTAEDFLAKNG